MGIYLSIIFKENYSASKKSCTAYKQKWVQCSYSQCKVNVQIRNSQIHVWLHTQNITKTLNGAFHTKYCISRSQSHVSYVKKCHTCLASNSILHQGLTIWRNLHPKVTNIATKKLFVHSVKSVYIGSLSRLLISLRVYNALLYKILIIITFFLHLF